MSKKKQNKKEYPRADNSVYLQCHGPDITPLKEKCLESKDPSAKRWLKIGWHIRPAKGNCYNGIRSWRCRTCFEEPRKRVAKKNSK